MNIIIKNINYDNILIEYKDEKYLTKYNLDKFILLGIPIEIEYKNIKYNNNNIHVYISNIEYLDKLLTIEKTITKKINLNKDIKLLKYDKINRIHYIVCKNKNNKSYNSRSYNNKLHINIIKVYNNIFYNNIL